MGSAYHRLQTFISGPVLGLDLLLPIGCANTRLKNCILQPAAGRRTQFFNLVFTQPLGSNKSQPSTKIIISETNSGLILLLGVIKDISIVWSSYMKVLNDQPQTRQARDEGELARGLYKFDFSSKSSNLDPPLCALGS